MNQNEWIIIWVRAFNQSQSLSIFRFPLHRSERSRKTTEKKLQRRGRGEKKLTEWIMTLNYSWFFVVVETLSCVLIVFDVTEEWEKLSKTLRIKRSVMTEFSFKVFSSRPSVPLLPIRCITTFPANFFLSADSPGEMQSELVNMKRRPKAFAFKWSEMSFFRWNKLEDDGSFELCYASFWALKL